MKALRLKASSFGGGEGILAATVPEFYNALKFAF
jgi:hypothetical protein